MPVLQQKGTESNQKRIVQTVMFIGLNCGELVAVPFGFALETQRSPRRALDLVPMVVSNIGSYNRMSLVSDRKPNIY